MRILCICSLFIWFVRSVLPLDRSRFVERHLTQRLNDRFSEKSARHDALCKFTFDYLQADGVLLLRLISHNTDGITTTQIAGALFDKWYEHCNEERKDSKGNDELDEVTSLKS